VNLNFLLNLIFLFFTLPACSIVVFEWFMFNPEDLPMFSMVEISLLNEDSFPSLKKVASSAKK